MLLLAPHFRSFLTGMALPMLCPDCFGAALLIKMQRNARPAGRWGAGLVLDCFRLVRFQAAQSPREGSSPQNGKGQESEEGSTARHLTLTRMWYPGDKNMEREKHPSIPAKLFRAIVDFIWSPCSEHR